MYKILFSKFLFHKPFITFWTHIKFSLIFPIYKQTALGQNTSFFLQKKYLHSLYLLLLTTYILLASHTEMLPLSF